MSGGWFMPGGGFMPGPAATSRLGNDGSMGRPWSVTSMVVRFGPSSCTRSNRMAA